VPAADDRQDAAVANLIPNASEDTAGAGAKDESGTKYDTRTVAKELLH